MATYSELKANLLMQRWATSSGLMDTSETRVPQSGCFDATKHLTKIPMSTRRWLLAVALSVAIALSASISAVARVNVPPGDSDGGGGDDGVPTEPTPASDSRVDNAPPEGGVWQHAHGSSANTGFAKVDTATAASHRPFTYLGAIAPGANPVVGPDGTVYIGNLQGQLHALHRDGTPYWTRQLNGLHGGIFAAPVVGNDGSVYVVSSVHYRDHRSGVSRERNDSYLHKFSPGGGWYFAMPFPEHSDGGATNAPPNIWRFNGTEAIMVPVVYKPFPTATDPQLTELRLLAFSVSGTVIADQFVTQAASPTTTGGGGDWFNECVETYGGIGNLPFALGCVIGDLIYGYKYRDYRDDYAKIPLPSAFPLPGVAIRPDSRGGAPVVMVTDGRQDKIAYAFSPESGFTQLARSTHTARTFTTPPVVQGNGNTVTGT